MQGKSVYLSGGGITIKKIDDERAKVQEKKEESTIPNIDENQYNTLVTKNKEA